MATIQDDIIALNTRFYQIADVNHPGMTVVMDNDIDIPEPKAVWCRLSIQPGFQTPLGMGGARYFQHGRIYLQIFIPARLGRAGGTAIEQTFTQAFRGWLGTNGSKPGSLKTFDPTFTDSDAEPEYYTIVCSVEWRAEHP